MSDRQALVMTPQELAAMMSRIDAAMPELNRYEKLPGVRYDDPDALQRYRDAAEGLMLAGNTEKCEKEVGFSGLEALFEGAHSAVAKAAVLNLYKKARAAVQSGWQDQAAREALWQTLERIKAKRRASFGEAHDVAGCCEDANRWIYAYADGPMVREAHIRSHKQGLKPLEIVQFTDAHFNYCNQKDLEEANPALMSTLEHRLWHANGDSVHAVERAFAYAEMSDQTVVTGDIMDYLSWGALEMTEERLFWRDTNLLAAIGGHEVTREMQGEVADPSSLESRLSILRGFWCNDISYASRVLGDRVILSVMDNGSTGTYSERQYRLLQSDIDRAREQNLILLIFQHEPICTCNPAETNAEFVRANDAGGSRNFYRDFVGGYWAREVLHDEWTIRTHRLIRESADVIRGVFCGHRHSDFYTEILGTDGSVIPQYVLTATVYDNLGHVMKITVD